MHCCKDCGHEFTYCDYIEEDHTKEGIAYEKIRVCPNCKSSNFTEQEAQHCRCCGRKLPRGTQEYCNSLCRRRGELMWQEQAKRRNIKYKSPIELIIREIEEYNKAHNTNYSYGFYVGNILKRRKNNDSRRN